VLLALALAWIVPCAQAQGAEVDRCLRTPRLLAADSISVEVSRNGVVDPSGEPRQIDSAMVRMTGVRVGAGVAHATAGFALMRYADTRQAWLSFAPSWDASLAGMIGFAGDVNLWLSPPDDRFVNDAGLST
jgi:hypothetical protein